MFQKIDVVKYEIHILFIDKNVIDIFMKLRMNGMFEKLILV